MPSSGSRWVTVVTNVGQVAEAVGRMTRGETMQEAVEQRAMVPASGSFARILEVFSAAEPVQVMHWGGTCISLSAEEARKACSLEIDFFRKLGVYEKVLVRQANDSGHKISGGRWVDVEKAEEAHRSRLVAKGTKRYMAPERFAATPPIGSPKSFWRRATGH